MKPALAPIVLFVYNRPKHTRQVIDALLENPLAKESELFIYSDGHKDEATAQNVQEVRDYIRTIQGFKNITIIEREKNWGLADSIIDGVTTIINQYEKIIVLEDDLLVSPCFLEFMNTYLELYKDDQQVACISAFNFPIHYPQEMHEDVFFIKGADCWTWATWKRAWEHFEKDGQKLLAQITSKNLQKDFDINGSYPYLKMLKDQIKGKNHSWAIRWYASAFLANMLCLYPKYSLVENIGYDGTHFKNEKSSSFFGTKNDIKTSCNKILPEENPMAKHLLSKYLKNHTCIFSKIKRKIFGIFR